MSTQKYETFLKIVELGNITKAAELLGYSQSAISHVVASLESEWNVKLLIRDKQGVRLTPDGALLLPNIAQVVEVNRKLLHQVTELHQLDQGVIRIGGFHSASMYLIPKLIKSFQAKYPGIQFETKQRGYDEMERMILDGSLDCGIIRLPAQLRIDTTPLFRDRMLAVFPKDQAPMGDSFPIKNVEHEKFIMISEMELEVLDYIKRHEVKLNKTAQADYDYSILPMIANGIGMCLLPEMMLQDTPYALTYKPLSPPAFRSIGIGFNQTYLSTATRTFIQHTIDYVQTYTDFETFP